MAHSPGNVSMEMADDVSEQEYSITFDWTDAESVTAAIIDAVAMASKEDPLEIEPLYSVIDTDSLDSLFDPNRNQPDLVVEFRYGGMRVQVSSTGKGYVFVGS